MKLVKTLSLCAFLFMSSQAQAMISQNFDTRDGITGRVNLNYGVGSAYDSDGGVVPRTMTTGRASAMPGWALGNFIPALYGEYQMGYQQTPSDNISDSNLKGAGWLVGLGLTYRIQRFEITGVLKGWGSYTQDKKDSKNRESILMRPFGGAVSVEYFVMKIWELNTFVGLNFDYTTWNQIEQDGSLTDLYKNPTKTWTTALSASFRY